MRSMGLHQFTSELSWLSPGSGIGSSLLTGRYFLICEIKKLVKVSLCELDQLNHICNTEKGIALLFAKEVLSSKKNVNSDTC